MSMVHLLVPSRRHNGLYGMIAMGHTTVHATVHSTAIGIVLLLLKLGPILRRGVNHQKEALLGCGELRYVVFGVCSSDVLLHRAVSLFTNASLAATGAILISQWADDFVVCIGD